MPVRFYGSVTFTLSAADLVRRLVALVPPAKSHLTSFYGSYAPHSKLRSFVTTPSSPQTPKTPEPKLKRPRLDWASVH